MKKEGVHVSQENAIPTSNVICWKKQIRMGQRCVILMQAPLMKRAQRVKNGITSHVQIPVKHVGNKSLFGAVDTVVNKYT